MKCFPALSLISCLIAVTLSQPAAAQSPPPAAVKPTPAATQTGKFVVGEPIRYKNLTVFAVASVAPANDDRYITLDEGLNAGTVQVFEVGAEPRAARANGRQRPVRQAAANAAAGNPFGVGEDAQGGADVNQLMVLNRSGKPLYLMPGEIIYGGQQDRTIGVEAVIASGTKPVPIAVYCVEHGRWSSRDEAETNAAVARLAESSGRTLDAKERDKLSKEAQQGKFVVPAGSLSKAARAVVQEGKEQEEVWDQVGKANDSSQVVTKSSAFTANYTDPQLAKQLQVYTKELQSPVAKYAQVVGAIVAINGKVESIDVFQSTPLFQKLWPKLLQSHALDAFAVAKQPGAEKTCSVNDAQAFLDEAMKAAVAKKSTTPGGLAVTKRESENLKSFSAGGMGGMGGNFDEAVHGSAYKK